MNFEQRQRRTVLTIRSMAGGEGYAQRHLQQSDYYDQKRTVEGQWHGRGAELLGLSGKVTSEDFESLRQGLDPETGDFLRQRQGSDRISADGAELSKARSLYDMTFSAPKSVSVMAIAGGDDRLIAAHETAVRETLQEAEKYAATRVRLAGLNENRTTGNWVVAAYTHDTSRELDPQLHTHAVAANLTYDGTEARWKALQAIPHIAEELPRRKACVKAASGAPRSGRRALTRAASRPCSHVWGLARAPSFEIFSITFFS